MKLSEHNIILTGATGGIGEAVAKALNEQGAKLLLVGRNEDKLQRLVEELSSKDMLLQLDTPAKYLVCDISLENEREILIEKGNEFGASMLINNAGINQFGSFIDKDERLQGNQNIEAIIQVNTISPIALCQLFLADKTERASRTIVNVGSAFGSIGFPYYANYCASKFALKGFSEALHRELADSGDQVFYFAPRATATTMNSDAVNKMNTELDNHVDSPKIVADALVKQLHKGNVRQFVGWPERFFATLNAIFPRVVDNALMKKSKVMKRFISKKLKTQTNYSLKLTTQTLMNKKVSR